MYSLEIGVVCETTLFVADLVYAYLVSTPNLVRLGISGKSSAWLLSVEGGVAVSHPHARCLHFVAALLFTQPHLATNVSSHVRLVTNLASRPISFVDQRKTCGTIPLSRRLPQNAEPCPSTGCARR